MKHSIKISFIAALFLLFQNCGKLNTQHAQFSLRTVDPLSCGDRIRHDGRCLNPPMPPESPLQFEERVYKQYKLGTSYSDVRTGLRRMLQLLDSLYLNMDLLKIIEDDRLACPLTDSTTKIRKYSAQKSWSELTYLAEVFFNGIKISEGDPVDPTLSDDLQIGLIKIADYMIKHANATTFNGYLYRDLATGQVVRPYGWTPFDSEWDSFNNGTCTSRTNPSAWSTAHVMQVMVMAYKLSGDSKYLEVFRNAGSYYFQRKNVNQFLTQYLSASLIQKIGDRLSAQGPYRMTPNYTVGGSRFQDEKALPADQLFIRFHYREEDPGLFALEAGSSMALAFILAGKYMPKETFDVSDTEGSFVARSWANIGLYSMMPLHYNLARGNYSYSDMDSASFVRITPESDVRNKEYEVHMAYAIHYLSVAGGLLNNRYFRDQATAAVTDLLTNHQAAVNKWGNGHLPILTCLNRTLSDSVLKQCRTYMATMAPKSIMSHLHLAIVQAN